MGTTAVGFATLGITGDRPIEIVWKKPRESHRDGMGAWIERIERRVESAEALAVVDGVSTVADAVDGGGGLVNVESLAGKSIETDGSQHGYRSFGRAV